MAHGESQHRRQLVRRIKLRMQVLGLNNGDVARGVGAAHSAVSDWLDERKTSLPSALKLMRMPAVLRCSSDWLLGLSERIAPVDATTDERSTTGYLAALLDIKHAADDLALAKQGKGLSSGLSAADVAARVARAGQAVEQVRGNSPPPRARPTAQGRRGA